MNRSITRRERGTLFLLSSLSLAIALETNAQTAGAEVELEEVLVTATRRSASVQDVPLAVTAIGESTLQEANIARLDEYLRLAPGVTFSQSGGASGNLQMRGVATSPRQAQTQSAVSQFIDEVPADDGAKSINTLDMGVFDVSRIELLRGPQGTLFGSGSLSGAIRIITNQPNLEKTEGALEITGGTIDGGAEDYAVSGMVNVPLANGKFAVRAMGYYREDGGWIDQVTLGDEDFNENKSFGGRLLAKGSLSERLDVTGAIYYQKREVVSPFTLLEPTPTAPNNRESMEGLVIDEAELENTFYHLKFAYEGDGFDFLSLTTYKDNDFFTQTDLSAALGNAVPIPYQLNGESTAWFQEFRLTSNTDSPLEWTLGVFYTEREREVPNGAESPVPVFGTTNIIFNNTITDTVEASLYGEASWQFNDQWRATLGGRFYMTESEGFSETSGLLNGLVTTFVEGDQDESGFTPKLALFYDMSDSVNLYATASQGFRTGDFNVVSGGVSNIPASFDSDSLWNYEIGMKSQFADPRLTANVALFFIDWDDIQIAQRSLDGFNFTGNAGAAESMGVEVELTFAPTDNLEIGGTLALLETELTETIDTVIQSDGTIGAESGSRLPGSPEETFSAYARYSFNARGRPGFVRADYLYTGSAFTDFEATAGEEYGSATLVNFNIGYDFSDSISGTFYVNNALNSDDQTAVIPAGFLGPGTAILLRPRTMGLTLRANF